MVIASHIQKNGQNRFRALGRTGGWNLVSVIAGKVTQCRNTEIPGEGKTYDVPFVDVMAGIVKEKAGGEVATIAKPPSQEWLILAGTSVVGQAGGGQTLVVAFEVPGESSSKPVATTV